jgi:hypothetical protein
LAFARAVTLGPCQPSTFLCSEARAGVFWLARLLIAYISLLSIFTTVRGYTVINKFSCFRSCQIQSARLQLNIKARTPGRSTRRAVTLFSYPKHIQKSALIGQLICWKRLSESTSCYLHNIMQSLTKWTSRLLSQPLKGATRFPMSLNQFFSSHCPLLDLAHQDSEKPEVRRKSRKEYQFKRFRADDTYRERKIASNFRYLERCRADSAAFDARCKQSNTDRSLKYTLDREFRKRIRFRSWVTLDYRGIRKGLVWKTHEPVLYGEKVKHSCVGCGYTPQGGLKFCKPPND